MKGQIKVTAKDDSGERKGVRREREGINYTGRLQGRGGYVGRNENGKGEKGNEGN